MVVDLDPVADREAGMLLVFGSGGDVRITPSMCELPARPCRSVVDSAER